METEPPKKIAQCELCGCKAFTKDNEYFVCQQCNSKYKKEDLLGTTNTYPTPVSNITKVDITRAQKNNREGLGCLLVLVVCIITLLLPCVPLIKEISDDRKKEGNNTSIYTEITKIKPNVRTVETLTGFDYEIYCNDNYDIVEITVKVMDEEGAIIHTETLQGFNYTKGNTYILSFEAPLEIILTGGRISWSVTKYK